MLHGLHGLVEHMLLQFKHMYELVVYIVLISVLIVMLKSIKWLFWKDNGNNSNVDTGESVKIKNVQPESDDDSTVKPWKRKAEPDTDDSSSESEVARKGMDVQEG